MKIRFLRDYLVKDDTGTAYKKGQVCDMVETSARHFLNRGLAVDASAEVETSTVRPAEKAVRTGPKVKTVGTQDYPNKRTGN